MWFLSINEWNSVSSVKLQGQLEEAVDERTKLVISVLNSGENQVAKSFELFDVKCMYLQAEKVNMGLFIFWKGFETVLGVPDKTVIPEASSLAVLTEMYHLRSMGAVGCVQ